MKTKRALTNGKIFSGYKLFEKSALLIDGENIVGIVSENDIPADYIVEDVHGSNVCPGLIDLQIYGTGNVLFSSELTAESIRSIEEDLLKQGCTSFYLTLATNTLEIFKDAGRVFNAAKPEVALGLHFEGPFLNSKKRGAHPEELIIEATDEAISDLLSTAENSVKMMTIAPELVSDEAIKNLLARNILLSAGHSAATAKQTAKFYERGIKTATHLWNAMSPFHHRDVGLPGEILLDKNLSASIIVDGVHVDYETVALSKKLMGERLFLITDAVGACEKGIYKHVFNQDHYELPDGTLSGSSLSMLQAIKNCVNQVDIPLDEAIRMATLYPANLIGRSDLGNLNAGAIANVLVFDQGFEVNQVIFRGKSVSAVTI
ncbi:N-acetylglucosamine-6-phosphate deacetylase [Sphingobacterium hungaricum]|uniref:N-acetylglucosamine-6-phosphate deacetylase n=1 Tax=Sphingobacterium hungaricum TaxID=2082723 RepID=A0A928UXC5_9SPHI|nr:N-acetylglucosamine-6-phosphate deacetylase [Sphingobacterium hungaricum]MBE8713075.1 N-acetylglucosamine-6-phosphate deacetylase [Sphingobacterium hungaricum]